MATEAEELLERLKEEREKFTEADKIKMTALVCKLIEIGEYPEQTVPGNPNSVFDMVQGWGAYWHQYRPPFECRHCGEDLCDRDKGPPFKREIGHYNWGLDRVTRHICPKCGKTV